MISVRRIPAFLLIALLCSVQCAFAQARHNRAHERAIRKQVESNADVQLGAQTLASSKQARASSKNHAEPVAILAMPKKAPKHPINIEIVGTSPRATSVQVSSGWPITVRLKANNELGIGVADNILFAAYPSLWHKGYVVFSDPDGCYSWLEPQFRNDTCGTDPPYEFDETWLEFRPDIDLPGLFDPAGGVALGANPLLTLWDMNDQVNKPLPIGPDTGGAARDGYGFGHDDDLPGLMVLSDAGVGLVFDQDFNLEWPLTARNLAGLGHSVSYVLDDRIPTLLQSGRTVVEWHVNVPHELVKPLLLKDGCVGNPPGSEETSCEQADIYRMDGGPQTTVAPSPGLKLITVRAFVVNGMAPDTLADQNGDGIVGAEDAKMAGYTVLSDEGVFSFYVVHQGMDQPLLFDFDANGSPGGYSIPAGSGGLTRRPE